MKKIVLSIFTLLFIAFLGSPDRAGADTELREYSPPDNSFEITVPTTWKIDESPAEGIYTFSGEKGMPFLLVQSVRYPTTKIWDNLSQKEMLINAFKGTFVKLLVNLVPDGEIIHGDDILEIKGPRLVEGLFRIKSGAGIIRIDLTYRFEDMALYSLFKATMEDSPPQIKTMLERMTASFKQNPAVFEKPYTPDELVNDVKHSVEAMVPALANDWRFKVTKVSVIKPDTKTLIRIKMQYDSREITKALADFGKALPFLQQGVDPPFATTPELMGFVKSFSIVMGTVVSRAMASGLDIERIIFYFHDSRGKALQSIAVADINEIFLAITTNNAQGLFGSLEME